MAARLLCLIAFIAILSQFGKTVLGMVGLPNLIPPARDGLLLLLTLVALARTDVFKSRGFHIAALLYLLVILVDVVIAAVESRHFAGLYYARLYLLPLFSVVAIRGLIMQAPASEVRGLVRLVMWTGLVVIAAAFVIFMAVEYNPVLINTLMSGGLEDQQIPTAWYIAGGAWARMGLPATSPNALGLMLAFYLLFVVSLMMDGRFLKLGAMGKVCVLLPAVLAIVMTFSRSSWVSLMLGGLVIFTLCRREWGVGSAVGLLKLAGIMAVLAVLIGCALVYVDSYSGGLISTWINFNKTGTDPSMVGHGQSVIDGIDALPEYFWLGYPKGTVSARALLFGESLNNINNVENSILGVFYAMGVPLGMVFLLLVAALLWCVTVHKSQWGMLAAFTFSAMLLPYVFEPDMIALFMTLSVLMGRALQCSDEARAQEALAGSKPGQRGPLPKGGDGGGGVPRLGRGKKPRASAATAFQATIFETR